VTTPLKISEVLFSLQDFMTKDGAISPEHREFYMLFRDKMNAFEDIFSIDNIELLLAQTYAEVENISQEVFIQIDEAILTQYRNDNSDAINERIQRLAAEEAAKYAASRAARLVEEERLAE